MKNTNGLIIRFFLVALFSSLAIVAGSAAVSADHFPGPAATVTVHPDRLDFEPNNPDAGLTLTVSGANGAHYSATHAPGDAPAFALADNAGNQFPDGAAKYELKVNPVLGAQAREDGKAGPAGASQSGGFAIVDGAIVYSAGGGGPGGDSDPGGPVLEDQVILDDLIVDGSLCVGQDCVNGESFGFDTIRLKENNLRIRFVDTSSSASFPSRDWQITANDSANGGANKFSIDDIDGGVTPFTIEAGAGSHSLYVDDGGRIGSGTSTPVVDIHVKTGNTPTLRLEQDGSSGFTPQAWDVAGNEANYFIRDATNGSTLPFRIQPGAPSSSLSIMSDGKVGMGTWGPSYPVHLLTDSSTDAEIVAEKSGGASAQVTGTSTTVEIGAYTDHQLEFTVNDTSKMVIDTDGKVGIGTTSPGFQLEVETTGEDAVLWLERSGNVQTYIYAGASTGFFGTANAYPLRLMTSGSWRMELATDNSLAMRSGATCDATGHWLDASSRELKENIVSLTENEAMETLARLDPVKFNYKADEAREGYVGFIAEDVPDLVATRDRKTMSAMDVTAVLTRVVQDQQRIIAEHSATIAELKKALLDK